VISLGRGRIFTENPLAEGCVGTAVAKLTVYDLRLTAIVESWQHALVRIHSGGIETTTPVLEQCPSQGFWEPAFCFFLQTSEGENRNR
jgi:hypothetical protein